MLQNIYKNIQNFFNKTENVFVFGSLVLFIALMSLIFIDTSIYYKSLLLISGVGFLWWSSYKHTAYILYGLIGWFAFENIILKYSGADFAFYIKYVPEIILYITFIFVLIQKALRSELHFIKTPINFMLGIFILIGCVSILFNGVSFVTGILGMRQVLRFVVLFYLIIYAHLSKQQLKKMVLLFLGIGIFQVLIGLFQWLTQGAFNHYFILEESFFVGESFEIAGADSLWSPQQRIFGTFKRYNELGGFLTLIVSLFVGIKYYYKKWSDDKDILFWLFSAGLGFAILLTYARSAWIAGVASLVFLAVWIKRDKIFTKYFFGIFGILVATLLLYVSFTQVNVLNIRDVKSATLTERVLQTFSLTELQGSYDGFGRLYFFVNTPKVVAQSPLVGVGPGMYGGGVAAMMQNKTAYENAGVAFGIFGETGQIDNNWFSLWGEFGTLGLLFFILILWRLYKAAQSIHKNSRNIFAKIMGFAMIGMIISFIVLGAFGPYFEIRTFSFYFWLCAGITIALGTQINEEQFHRITKPIKK